jgi:hypothetical protein
MEATEELIEMTGDKDDETTRLAIAKEDACPWLGKILGTYIELKYGADAPGSPKRDHTTSLDAIDEVNPNTTTTTSAPTAACPCSPRMPA